MEDEELNSTATEPPGEPPGEPFEEPFEEPESRHYDMIRPCTQCPFTTGEAAIRFRNRERAEEIEESAYRRGFPCHVTAELVETDGPHFGQQDGYHFGNGTQHCAGYTIMCLKSGHETWPGMGNDEELSQWLQDRIDWDAPVFDRAEDFFDANDFPSRTT